MIINNLPNYKKIVLVIILLAIIFHELIWHYIKEIDFISTIINSYSTDKKNEKNEKNEKDKKQKNSKENFSNINTYSLSNIFKNKNNNNNKNENDKLILNTNQYNFLPNFFEKNLSKSNFLKSNILSNMTPEEYFKIENRNLKANNSEYKKK